MFPDIESQITVDDIRPVDFSFYSEELLKIDKNPDVDMPAETKIPYEIKSIGNFIQSKKIDFNIFLIFCNINESFFNLKSIILLVYL